MLKELHEKLINGETTSEKLTEGYLARIEKENENINAFLTITKELALAQARKIDEKIRNGKEIGMLEGIPGGIKDLICIQGVRTTGGSKILDNYIAPYDATVIKKLKESGAVFLGKTNCDEFAMGSSTENSAYGPTRNPRDLERVPGGTSGGSAAAIAADMAAWTLGTDTGGSTRQPAAFCGVVGLKPTYGRVSRYGVLPAASSLEQVGVISKTVEDAAIVLSVIAGQDRMDATTAHSSDKDYISFLTGEVKGLKIGIVKEYLEALRSDVKESVEKVIEKYRELGAEIKEIELPYAKYSLPVYYIINFSEISSNLAKYDGIKYGMSINDEKDSHMEANSMPKKLLETYLDSRQYGLGAEVKRRIMLGTYALSAGYYDAYYLKAQKVRTLIKNDFEKAFNEVDLILTPTTPTPAFKLGEKTDDPLEMYLADIFTVISNVAGIPTISVPGPEVEVDGKKLPLGFQLMGRWFDEENVLRAAHAYEINK
ncbi:MAG: Asp-tRNA(Asn)/Glu-tRNA(Gln) amidotransferase subunit GatA [Candidatus Moraniibacteriota bacterium]